MDIQELDVQCSDCGSWLKIVSYGSKEVAVEPCERCLEAMRDEGYEDGYSDGEIDGHDQGYDEGYEAGLEEGRERERNE